MNLTEIFGSVTKFYAQAVSAGNFQPIFANLAENVIFTSTILDGTPISGKFIGKKKVMDYYINILPSVATFKQLVPAKFVICKDRVIIVGEHAFTLIKNGKTYHRPYVSIIKIDNHLISEITVLQDLFGVYLAYQG